MFARGYSKGWRKIGSWAENHFKIEEILWLTIPYYLVADFNDSKKSRYFVRNRYLCANYNTWYPYPDEIYDTKLSISLLDQVLDGETALKYARSNTLRQICQITKTTRYHKSSVILLYKVKRLQMFETKRNVFYLY